MSTFGKLFDWAKPQKKRVYYLNEGTHDERNILGAKGANLCEMHRMGLPVPAAFIVTAECCVEYFKEDGLKGSKINTHIWDDICKGIHELEMQTGKSFGMDRGVKSPMARSQQEVKHMLLLSVRAGAMVSMPGMMDSVLNLGINDEIAEAMARATNNPRWAYDTYRRFLQMFGNVVLHTDKQPYEDILDAARKRRAVPHESLLPVADLQDVVEKFKLLAHVPEDPWDQLRMAVEAVFRSWYSPLAMKYRDIHGIPGDLGTAVTVQSMVYGNQNVVSGSGVAFTRNPTTGAKELYGEYLTNSEGEDVSSGSRTPMKLTELRKEQPGIFDQLMHYEAALERHFRDMQDIEFTVENRHLWILETRTAKRTPQAAVRAAVDMVKEKLITEREALLRIDPNQMDFFLHPTIDTHQVNFSDPAIKARILSHGAKASPGCAVGQLVFTVQQAIEKRAAGELCILVRPDTSVDDLEGLRAADGVITLRGGLTSHAAVVMRGMGKSAVVGATNLRADWTTNTLTCIDRPDLVAARLGDQVTVDGTAGVVYMGAMPTTTSAPDDNFATVMQWANKYKRLAIYANAEREDDIRAAHRFGAEGLGLCRTEHMFQRPECADLFRRVIFAEDVHTRNQHLAQIEAFHLSEFLDIFRLMGDAHVTVRLLDPPLHEFLPNTSLPNFEEELAKLAHRLDLPFEVCSQRVQALQEANPLMGFRGCRLSIVHPEITEMQTKAIVGAAIQARAEHIEVKPRILMPFVVTDHEVDLISSVIVATAASTCLKSGFQCDLNTLEISLGAMIETPRACIRADRIAESPNVSFVSVGGDNLSQLVFGLSKEDSDAFMATYLEQNLVAHDPFSHLDVGGVGGMIQMAVRRCRRADHRVKIGICGEHSGDPASIAFFERLGVDYVSCAPYRIPIAKVAAAQAHIQETASLADQQAKLHLYKRMATGEFLI